MSVLFHTETYDFILEKTEAEGRTGARILRISGESGEETLLLDYLWPAQLTVEVEAGNVLLREDGVLCWELHVTAHHVKGMGDGLQDSGYCQKDTICDRGTPLKTPASSDLSLNGRPAGTLRPSVNRKGSVRDYSLSFVLFLK